MKKNKLKIFSALMICFAFVGILLFSSNNKIYASEVSSNSISKTNNILDSSNLYQGTTMGNSGLPIIEPNNLSRVVTKDFISVIPNRIYSIKCYKENMQVYEINYYDIEKNIISLNAINQSEYQFTIPSNCYYIILLFRMADNDYIYVNDVVLNVMYNLGSFYLPYEPYIPLINNEGYNAGYNAGYSEGYNAGLLDNATSVLYKAFNGATANLIYDNDVIISEAIYLTENDLYLSINNISDIKTYLNNDETSRYYTLSISLNSAINNELVVSLNNDILDTTLTLFNSLGGYRETFSRPESSLYTIIANSQGKYYDTIVYDSLYAPDYIDFKLNLDLSQLTFEEGYNAGLDAGIYEGYNKGSQEGYNNGFNKGYNEGKIDGYNNGYNEGASSNIETNSIKTLFNSILSYPVNLVSNVLDFEFMGINIASLIMFIVSIGIVVFVVKKFW